MFLFGHVLPALVLLAQEQAQPEVARAPAWITIAIVAILGLLMFGVIVIAVVLLLVLSRRKPERRPWPSQLDEPNPGAGPDGGVRAGPPPS
jgi:hypothetical protein